MGIFNKYILQYIFVAEPMAAQGPSDIADDTTWPSLASPYGAHAECDKLLTMRVLASRRAPHLRYLALSPSICAMYFCIASSLLIPFLPFQAVHLARPFISKMPGHAVECAITVSSAVESTMIRTAHLKRTHSH